MKLSADYEAEQKELMEQVRTWRDAVETFEQDQADFASFAAIVRKTAKKRQNGMTFQPCRCDNSITSL